MTPNNLQEALACVRDARYRRDNHCALDVALRLPTPQRRLALDSLEDHHPITIGPARVVEIATHGRWGAVRYRNNQIDLLDLKQRRRLHRVRPPVAVTWMAFSPDGGHLYMGRKDDLARTNDRACGALYAYSCRKGRYRECCPPGTHTRDLINHLHTQRLTHPCFDATSPVLLKIDAMGASFGTFEVWSPALAAGSRYRRPWEIKPNRRLHPPRLWGVKCLHRLTPPKGLHDPNNHRPTLPVLLGYVSGQLRVVDALSAQRALPSGIRRRMQPLGDMVVDEARGVVITCDSKCVRLWSLQDLSVWQSSHTLHDGPATCLGLLPTSGEAVSAGEDGLILRWSVGSPDKLHLMGAHEGAITAMKITECGGALCGDVEGVVRLWSGPTG